MRNAETVKKETIKEAVTDDDILKCWDALKLLRPHLERQSFLSTVREMMREGYRLAFIERDGVAASVAGFRYLQILFHGKHFYIDDLSTLEEYRGRGYGETLLEYVAHLAKKNGFRVVTLDSGFGRHDAHRLYLNKGYRVSSLHFVQELTG